MNIDFGIWENIPAETVARMMDGGSASLLDLRPSEHLMREIGDLDANLRVLDFGCGVGRDIAGMVKVAPRWSVIGYDNAQMILRAFNYLDRSSEFKKADVLLESDWDKVTRTAQARKFDVVFCDLVLQHVPEQQLRWHLSQFREIGDELFVYGRRAIDRSSFAMYGGGDDFESVWDIVLDFGYEIASAQNGFSEKGNGNDHHWVKFKQKGKVKEDVLQPKRGKGGREEQRRGSDASDVGIRSENRIPPVRVVGEGDD